MIPLYHSGAEETALADLRVKKKIINDKK